MSDFTVLTDDERLADRIRVGLATDDVVRRIGGGTDVRVPRPRPGEPDLIVLDLRNVDPGQAIAELVEFRKRFTVDRRVIAIVASNPTGAAVVSSTQEADVDFILDERVDIGMVIRAIANDRSTTACAAMALLALQKVQRPVAQSVSCTVLGSGCVVCSAHRIAHALGMSESTLRSHLIHEGSPLPLAVIRLSSCVYALALARRTRCKVDAIRHFAGIDGDDAFRSWSIAMLGGSVRELAMKWPQLSLQAFLSRALAERPHLPTEPVKFAGGGGTPHPSSTVGDGDGPVREGGRNRPAIE